MEEELKKCSCGEEVQIVYTETFDKFKYYSLVCVCGLYLDGFATLPNRFEETFLKYSRIELISRWNRNIVLKTLDI